MKVSIIVEQKINRATGNAFMVASAKGTYLPDVENMDESQIREVTYYDVKIAKGTLPTVTGIYDVECEKGWKDTRPETTKNVVWLKNCTFTKKADLKPRAK